MGQYEEWPLPSGLLLNGLLPKESSSVIRALDGERWAKAEERTSELIACIQPNQPSEKRRGAVADYVQRLIMKCFPCQVFTFGSVPLKTYLPDGDIDVTAFSKNQTLKDTWAIKVRNILEMEEKNENAEFRVKEVQYIQAEVKIIKCLVENIVVDISFNQLGGLCTLCFLEEVDNLINQDHLFKRSIILIKAWCYYESRILGAHHGLISTYALETLVLYIFHIFNNSFTGPLEVLYRFLEFFSNFDWENFCVSLWGPVAISSLPDINVEPPRKDGGELLLSKAFLQACNSVYAVFPGGLENQGQPFVSKPFNVIDPLRINNNLGRSVSKGNFYRIRSAFAFGAKRLTKLLDCPKENIAFELNQFFTNTWGRHGSGVRPDAPVADIECLRSSNPDHVSDNNLSCSNSKESNDGASTRVMELDAVQTNVNLSSARILDRPEKGNLKLNIKSDSTLTNDQMVNPLQSKHLFARTRSSPQLTNAYCDASSRLTCIKPLESKRSQATSTAVENSQRKNVKSDSMSTQSKLSSSDVLVDPASVSNCYMDGSRTVNISEDHASVIGAQGMHQEEQDLVNMMASSSLHNFGGPHIPVPLNMGYAPRGVAGMFPANIPFIDPHWASNFHFHQGLASSPFSQFFPGVGLSTNSEAVMEYSDENLSRLEKRRGEYWHERDLASNGALDDCQPSTSGSSNLVSSSHMPSSWSSLKAKHKFIKENPGSIRDDVESFQHQDSKVFETFSDEKTSVRSKIPSESSWDGSSSRVSKVAREKRGRKAKGKNIHEYLSSEVDEVSRESTILPTLGNEIDSSTTVSQNTPTLHVGQHHIPGFDEAQTGGSSSVIPIPPMVLGHGPHQRGTDNSGSGPYTFFPTGPPVPFFTMLPFFNCPTEADNSEPSSSPLAGEDAPDRSDSGQNFHLSELHSAPNDLSAYNNQMTPSISGELSSEPKRDILNSDFTSHWQNLQFGRLCQGGPPYPGPIPGPTPVVVPPMYLNGRFPWDGPGRPLSANANVVSQLMSYGHRLVPVNPTQYDFSGPTTVYQQYSDELPRFRTGTGTYLPNPKAFSKDRHSSGTRRNSHNHDRSDHADREGNWNAAKSRAANRSHNRSHAEKSRVDRLGPNENRADRSWSTYRHQPPPYQAQNGPVRANSPNVMYGMYPLPGMNPGEGTSNGPTVVMLYPYGHNSGYVSPGEQQLEFGSLGPVGYVGPSDGSQPADAIQLRDTYEGQRYHRNSTHQSSPDQPSSPHFQRRN